MNNLKLIPSGTTVGKLTVIDIHHGGGSGRHAYYKCSCTCGNIVNVRSSKLRRKSDDPTCGRCLIHIVGSSTQAKLLYNVWLGMIYRCHRVNKEENSNLYEQYRGRGISVCAKWRPDVLEFAKWAVKNGYRKNVELDRINNNGNYTPSNCRFTDRTTQIRNRRVTRWVEYKGRPRILADVFDEVSSPASYSLVSNRIFDMGWKVEEALFTPPRKGNYH